MAGAGLGRRANRIDAKLRGEIVQNVNRWHGHACGESVYCTRRGRRQRASTRAREVLVVSGARQGLDRVARCLIDPRDSVVLDRPTHLGAIQSVGNRARAGSAHPDRLDAAPTRARVIMSAMSVLRFVTLVALALWIGGLAVLGGIGAPTIFAVLDAHTPSGGVALGGLVFGAVFERFQHLAWVLGAVLLAAIGARAALGPRPHHFGVRMWTVALMLAFSLISGLVLAPRIDAIREATPGSVNALADSNPLRIQFNRLHGVANGLMLATLLAGLGLMWAEMSDGRE
jgi:Domain of unknown function (DUF4149)